VGTNDGKVHTLHPDTGAPLWSNPWSTADGPVKGYVWPDVATGRIYFSTTSLVHAITDGGGSATAFWSPVSVSSASPPLLRGNRLYVGGADSGIRSIEADSTTPATTVRTVGDQAVPKTVGPPTLDVTQDLLIVGTDLGVIYAVAPF
jgi:outer membrane protein assembly factor BamB